MILEEKLLQVIHDEDVHILLCGDFNARTGCEQPKLDDMSNYTPGSEEDVIRGDWADRQPKDIVVNNFGKSLMILCFMIDCAILNSCCKGHRSEEYTYVSPHGSSVIDYFPMSEDTLGSEEDVIRGDRAERRSKDTVVNNFGKSLLNSCFMFDCVILNGCCNGNRSGEYTYVSPHGSSVTDYFLMSEDLF